MTFQFFIPVKGPNLHDKLIMSHPEISINYILSWFLLDLISSIPINSVLTIIKLSDENDRIQDFE
jgi:hypothetical protein